jgi:hypothetical protein
MEEQDVTVYAKREALVAIPASVFLPRYDADGCIPIATSESS